MRILVATDAWHPQVNGVVRTYQHLAREVAALGDEIVFLTPEDFRTVDCPGYPGLRLALFDFARANRLIAERAPDFIHVATEGPVGLMTRSHCRGRGRPFTSSYHTRFPEYASALFGLPEGLVYAAMRKFHASAVATMVATPSLQTELGARGFTNLVPWSRGVDCERFRPREIRKFGSGPVYLSVGRVSREKNFDAFLDLSLDGVKVVVGNGPYLAELKSRYPDAIFPGELQGDELATAYASADVFVFPSRTDTFGLVLLEAMASGLPVAAYPVTGPRDLIEPGVSGCLNDDLATAVRDARTLDRASARACALKYSWTMSAQSFVGHIEGVMRSTRGAPARRSGLAAHFPSFLFSR